MSKRFLNPDVEAILNEPDEVRIRFAQQDNWIGYTAANEILSRVEDLYNAPRTTRVKSMIVVGHSNAGKTSLKNRFLLKHPEEESPDGTRTLHSILHIEATSKADPSAFCTRILDALGAPYPKKASFETLSKQVLDVLKETEVRMIVIDEFHNFLVGRQDMKDALRNTMRTISNVRKVSFLAFGIPSALQFVAEEAQMSSRFKRAFFPKWEAKDNRKSFKQLLASFEALLPLRKESHLTSNALVNKLAAMSEGSLGDVADILEEGTIKAIKNKTEQITPALLDDLGWLTPTERESFGSDE
jgi:GTPase SAR1 family protein